MLQNNEIIIFIQGFRSEVLDGFFIAVSFILDAPMLMLLFAIIYWCVDKKYSVVFVISFFIGSILNGLVKIIVQAPRPGDPQIAILYGDSTKETYSFPSGHSQYASSLAAGISLRTYKSNMKQKWVLYSGSVFIALLGGFARLYLGVHYLEDVIAGLVMGVVIILILIWAISKINNELWFIIFLIPLYIIMIFQHDHSLYGFVGILTAIIAGFIIEKRYINMQYAKSRKISIMRVICGFPPALGLYSIRYFLLANVHIAIDYFIMFAIGAYLVLLMPLVFAKLKYFSETAISME